MMRGQRTIDPSVIIQRQGRILRRLFSVEFGVLLALLTVLLALVVFFAHYSGLLRWALLIFLLLLGGWVAGKFVYLQAVEVDPLQRRTPAPRLSRSRLNSLSRTLKRATQGMSYSQLSFAISMRDAFLEKVKAETGFDGETHELVEQLPILRPLLKDEEIYRFLTQVSLFERSMANVLVSNRKIFAGAASKFPEEMERILRKMEAWH